MISRLWTAFLLTLACASTLAWLVALMHEKDVRPVRDLVAFFKKQSKAGRVVLGTFFIAMWMFASVKPGDGGGNGGGNGGGDGGTNNVEVVVGSGGGLQPLDFCVSCVDVVAPLLTLGYLVGVLSLCGLTFRNLGGDVVGGSQSCLTIEDDALLGIDGFIDF